MPVHIKIQFDLGDYEAYEEYDNNSNNDSKASDTPPPTPQTPRSKLASQRSWRRALLRKVSSAPPSQSSAGFEPPAPAGSASNLSLARWDWKTIFYHWSFPLDEVIVGIRRVSVSLKVWRSSSMCFLFLHAAISLSSSIATPAPSMTTRKDMLFRVITKSNKQGACMGFFPILVRKMCSCKTSCYKIIQHASV